MPTIKGTCDVTGKDGKKLWALEYRSTADCKLLYVIDWNKKTLEIKLLAGSWQELFQEKKTSPRITIKPLEVKSFRRN